MNSENKAQQAQQGQPGNNRALFPETSQALATDFYQLTMAQGYYQAGIADRKSIFHMFYRHPPFGGRYVVAAGIESFADWLDGLSFSREDLAYLRSISGSNGKPFFHQSFLDFLEKWQFTGTVEATPEGTIVFPHEPIVRVCAPLLDAQIIETTLLAIINFQSLIATKASRVRLAAGDDEVLEFGLRRAHGVDGGLSASRAAHIGGADATSNVLAGARYGIPVRGTHAHSWVMAFENELEALHAYAEVFPNNSVLLVDTYDSLEGVRHAIDVGVMLRSKGADLMGVRLDSGDLAYLAKESRKLLDAHGFGATRIVASNDLDERLISSLKAQGAPIDIWGIGTKLVTAFDEPALGGVYKLAAIEDKDSEMVEKMKLSEQPAKTTIPGCLDVARLWQNDLCVGDVIFDTLTEQPPASSDNIITIISPEDSWKRKIISAKHIDVSTLLAPLFRDGQRIDSGESIAVLRKRTQKNLAAFDPAIFRFDNPHAYAAGLSQSLFERREEMRDRQFEENRKKLTSGQRKSI